jgi:hypothetical protein
MGQEWRLYDVGGARNTVRLLLNPLTFINKTNLITSGTREEHGIPTLMMVGNKDIASPNADLSSHTVDAIIFLA